MGGLHMRKLRDSSKDAHIGMICRQGVWLWDIKKSLDIFLCPGEGVSGFNQFELEATSKLEKTIKEIRKQTKTPNP